MHDAPVTQMFRRVAVVALGLLAIAAGSALRARAMEAFIAARTFEDTYCLPPPAGLEALSPGHAEAVASSLYPQALVYFGGGMLHRTPARHVFDYAEAMIALDPAFRAPYFF